MEDERIYFYNKTYGIEKFEKSEINDIPHALVEDGPLFKLVLS